MDAAKFKQTTTSRGYLYNYYHASAADTSKPTLLLLHGFPSNSLDWAGIAPLFEGAGYGLIVPDMLGYRGTAKPVDPAAYVGSGLCRDLTDILDAEGVEKAVAIGHDWGSVVISKLNSFVPERFLAFGFLAVGYVPPSPALDSQARAEKMMQMIGYLPFGYWPYMASASGAAAMEAHMDSFMGLIFASDATLHKHHLCPPGGIQKWIEADKRFELLSSQIATPEWAQTRKQELLKGGLEAPTCWYKVNVLGLAARDDANVLQERYSITKPIFFGACTQDAPSPPILGDAAVHALAKGSVTRKEYDSGHWVTLTHYEKLGKDLLEWLADFPRI